MVKNLPAIQETLGQEDPLEGNDNALQYSCLENPWTEEPGSLHSPWGRKESDTTESDTHAYIHIPVRVYWYYGNASGIQASALNLCSQVQALSLTEMQSLCPSGALKIVTQYSGNTTCQKDGAQ